MTKMITLNMCTYNSKNRFTVSDSDQMIFCNSKKEM